MPNHRMHLDVVRMRVIREDLRLGFGHPGYKDAPEWPQSGVVRNGDVGRTGHASFYAGAYGPPGAIHSGDPGASQFPWGAAAIMETIKKMIELPKPPVPYDEILENVVVATVGRQAQRTGKAGQPERDRA